MFRLLLLLLIISSTAHAEDVVNYSGSNYLNCRSIGNTNVFLDDPNDYATIKDGFIYVPDGCSSLPGVAKYRKISAGEVVEMTQQEKDAVDAAEEQARKDAQLASLDELQDQMKAVIVALVKRINARIPNNPITREEIVDQLKCDRGFTDFC